LAGRRRLHDLVHVVPALIAQDPRGIERECIAVSHSVDEEGAEFGRVEVLPLHDRKVGVARPEHQELLVELLREAVRVRVAG
jgi:hypothetical protein